MQTSIRSLDKDKLTVCAGLLLEVMAIHNDIFVEDLVALRGDKARVLALPLPYRLHIKEHARHLPVFTQRRTRGKNFVPHVVDESIVPVASSSRVPSTPPSTPSQRAKGKRASQGQLTDPSGIGIERYTAPMTVSTMSHIIRKIRMALGWQCT